MNPTEIDTASSPCAAAGRGAVSPHDRVPRPARPAVTTIERAAGAPGPLSTAGRNGWPPALPETTEGVRAVSYWCGARNITLFHPIALQAGPLLVVGDACDSCAAAIKGDEDEP